MGGGGRFGVENPFCLNLCDRLHISFTVSWAERGWSVMLYPSCREFSHLNYEVSSIDSKKMGGTRPHRWTIRQPKEGDVRCGLQPQFMWLHIYKSLTKLLPFNSTSGKDNLCVSLWGMYSELHWSSGWVFLTFTVNFSVWWKGRFA